MGKKGKMKSGAKAGVPKPKDGGKRGGEGMKQKAKKR